MKLSNFFQFEKFKASFKREIIGGIITFITVLYLIPTVASMMSSAGVEYDSAFIVLAMVSAISTFVMSLICNVSFVISCGLGLTSYLIYTVVLKLGFSYSETLVMIFISNILFLLMSIFKIRFKLINSIPKGIKSFISASLGVFLMVVGICSTGLFSFESEFVYKYNGFSLTTILGLIGIVIGLILFLIKKTRKIAIVVSVGFMTLLCVVLSLFSIEGVPSISWDFPGFSNVFNLLGSFWNGFSVLLDFRCYPLIFIILIMNILESTASIYALSEKIGNVDKDGNIRHHRKLGIIDSSCCVVGSTMGVMPVCILCESEASFSSGARTGLCGSITGLLLFLMIFIYPIFSIFAPINGMLPITSCATFIIGLTIFTNIFELEKPSVILLISGILMIIASVLSYSLSTGIGVGLLSFSILSLITGKAKEVGLTTYMITLVFTIGLVVQKVFF